MSIADKFRSLCAYFMTKRTRTARLRQDREADIYDPDELYELALDSALYVEAPRLRDMSFTLYPRDVFRLDTDALLESIGQLPYEFRCYYDTRRAFRRALEITCEELSGYVTYEGGRSTSHTEKFEYDDLRVTIDFTLSRDGDRAPYAFTVEIHAEQ